MVEGLRRKLKKSRAMVGDGLELETRLGGRYPSRKGTLASPVGRNEKDDPERRTSTPTRATFRPHSFSGDNDRLGF